MTRRTILKWLVNGVGALMMGAVAVPSLLSALAPAVRARRPRWQALGRLESFAVGEVSEAVIEPADVPDTATEAEHWPPEPRRGVYVWRPDAEAVVVFARACTDLGCPVNYDPGSECYYCPCHGGIFDTDGTRLAGPPERPLDRYLVRVRDGRVEVDPASVRAMV